MRRSERRSREIAAHWILLDLARWQADYRMQQTRTDLTTCLALWQMPPRQPRKETEQ